MDSKTLFGKRLRLVRQKEMLTMEELSQRTNGAVSKQMISKYESGMVMPKGGALEELATALNVAMDYFFRPFTFDVNEINISFRKKASVKAKDEAVLKSKIQDKVERYLEIENILSLESPPNEVDNNLTIINELQMKKIAKETRLAWNIGNAPIENAKEILIHHGVKVFEVEAPEGFDGVSGAANNSTWVIVLNKDKNHVERKRLTTFHEYGHLIANNNFDTSLTKKEKEDLCNVFASEMLLPSDVLRTRFGNKSKISLQELITLQCAYGISIDAIMYSLKRLAIISDKRHRSYCIRKNMSSAFKREVEESRFEEKETLGLSDSDTFTTMVYSALAQNLISPAKAAEFLDTTISDVQSKAIAF